MSFGIIKGQVGGRTVHLVAELRAGGGLGPHRIVAEAPTETDAQIIARALTAQRAIGCPSSPGTAPTPVYIAVPAASWSDALA